MKWTIIKDKFDTIYIDIMLHPGEGTVASDTIRLRVGSKFVNPVIVPPEGLYLEGWYKDSELSVKANKDDIVDNTFANLYAKFVSSMYEMDGNKQWRPAQSFNPSTIPGYEGFDVYESFSNYHVSNAFAKMYVDVMGYTTFTLYINSYAEANYDYTIAFSPDVDVISNPNSGTTGAVANTYGFSKNPALYPPTDTNGWKKVTYNLDGNSHRICICYRKDGSGDSYNDRGYVAIPHNQPQPVPVEPKFVDYVYPAARGTYFDTGIVPTATTYFELDFLTPSEYKQSGDWPVLLGAQSFDGNEEQMFIRYGTPSSGLMNINYFSDASQAEEVWYNIQTNYDTRYTIKFGPNLALLDGVTQSVNPFKSVTTTNTVYMFAGNYGNAWRPQQFRCYGLKVWDGDNLIANFRPYSDNYGAGAFYEEVTGEIRYASGEMTAGND